MSDTIDIPATPKEQVEHKPTMGEKTSGKVQELVGKTTNNETKVLEGQAKAKGDSASPTAASHSAITAAAGSDPSHPNISAPDVHSRSQDHDSNDASNPLHAGNETKHAEAHLRDPPHHRPGPRNSSFDNTPVDPQGEGNTNINTDTTRLHKHEQDKHSIHSAGIPPPAPFNSASAHRDHPVQGANIPLPPSHTNSFAPGMTPFTPDERGDRSTSYQAVGGMPTLHSTHRKHLEDAHLPPDDGSKIYTGLGRKSDSYEDNGDVKVHLLADSQRREDHPAPAIPQTISAKDPFNVKTHAPHKGIEASAHHQDDGGYFGTAQFGAPGAKPEDPTSPTAHGQDAQPKAQAGIHSQHQDENQRGIDQGRGEGFHGGERAGIIGVGGSMGRSGHTAKRNETAGDDNSHILGTDAHKFKKAFEADPAVSGAPIQAGTETGTGVGVGLGQGGVADRSVFPPEAGSHHISHERQYDDPTSIKPDHAHEHDHNTPSTGNVGPAFTSADVASHPESDPSHNADDNGTGTGSGTGNTGSKDSGKPKKPVTEKIAELVPGTAAHKERKEEKAMIDDAEKGV
ncbi:hypothetical protein IAU59_003365 [Kwoniella sp. CBS 9459]